MKHLSCLILLTFFIATGYSQPPAKDLKKVQKYVLKQSKKGGTLDFFSQLGDLKTGGISPGSDVYTKLQYSAIYQWAEGVRDAGVENVDQAFALYSQAFKKEPNDNEKIYISKGFNKELTHPTKPGDLKKMVINETVPGGRFDYFTDIMGHENDGFLVDEEKKIYTCIECVALYAWAKTIQAAGVASADEALAIYSEIKGRPLNEKEISYLTKGYNSEIPELNKKLDPLKN
jgi:hypothetical protein